jgi:uncharacterized membrane protein YphA (DoxX/SURF4 family)
MNRKIDATFLLQLVLGAALIVFGIMAYNGYNSAGQDAMRGLNKMFGKSNDLFPILFAIIQIVAGAALVAGLFVSLPDNIFKIVHLIICIFFLISIIMNFFLSNMMEPDFVRWLGALLPQLIILLSLWIIREQN